MAEERNASSADEVANRRLVLFREAGRDTAQLYGASQMLQSGVKTGGKILDGLKQNKKISN